MSERPYFVDTNVVIYAFSSDRKAETALTLLTPRATISVQVLNEFVHVARRKMRMSWSEVEEACAAVKALCGDIVSLTEEIQVHALTISSGYDYTIYDSSIIAAALDQKCDVLYSEDMQNDMIVEGRLKICNPFKA